MNLKEKLAFERYRILGASAHSADHLRKKALSFSRFFFLSILSFFGGICIYHTFGSPFKMIYTKRLLSFFTSPFDGLKTPYEYICRILFFAAPSFIIAAVLILSLTAKNKRRTLCSLLGTVQFFQGLHFPISTELWKNGLLPTTPSTVLYIFQLTTLIVSFLFCIYVYRLSLCISLGFPSRMPAPGTTMRFFSFTIRLLLWIILLISVCSVAVCCGNL